MTRLTRRRFLGQVTNVLGAATLRPTADARPIPEADDGEARSAAYEQFASLPVLNETLEPHWLVDGIRFWYRNDSADGMREFLLVDADRALRAPAFDHARLAQALTRATGTACTPDRLPFTAIEFSQDGQQIRFQVGETNWAYDPVADLCTPSPLSAPPSRTAPPTPDVPAQGLPSPDGRWVAALHGPAITLAASGSDAVNVTPDAHHDIGYERLSWSPDSRTLAAIGVQDVPSQPIYAVESSPADNSPRGVLHTTSFRQPGDPMPTRTLWLCDPQTCSVLPVDADPLVSDSSPDICWTRDGHSFTYGHMDRGCRRFRVIRVDARTGDPLTLLEETSRTFINGHNLFLQVIQTDTTDEFLYASECDGWRHLYLYDREKGRLKNQVTRGPWVVRGVERVDPDTRQIWFLAGGRVHGENPYHQHHCRVNFDGTDLVDLTPGDGEHFAQWSPDRRYLIDTCSRPDSPPMHTLRRASDGSLVCPLETADISPLTANGWRPPEVFRAKGRDGVTDIWGLVFRPLRFDPARTYPLIENIYSGPQDSAVRQTFAAFDSMQSLAELGFIVVQCDGMGTRNRSKAFHDVCWHNLADAGLPDRMAWIKALARTYPQVDLRRVGIYGTSAGGQNAASALLFHGDFYHVAVASCGSHDNRMDRATWAEQWMGYPVGPWYEEQSNITQAHRLRGQLLLMVGELDTRVPPEATLRLADALIRADKDFELLVLPGLDHTDGGPYGERRRRDFFRRHLLGFDPPDRNIKNPQIRD